MLQRHHLWNAMKLPRRRFLHLVAAAAALPIVSRIVWAQTYPSRPVRVIVPFVAGSATDVIARLITQKLSEKLARQFYIENIGGAGGNVGMGVRGQRQCPTAIPCSWLGPPWSSIRPCMRECPSILTRTSTR